MLIVLSPLLLLYSLGEGFGAHVGFENILGAAFISLIVGLGLRAVGKTSNTK